MKYKRVLLKLSGEALSKKNQIYNYEKLLDIFNQVKFLVEKNVQVSIVVGGGNIWRGEIAKTIDIDPIKADYMGMLSTSINSIALTSFFNKRNLNAEFINSFNIENISKNYSPDEIIEKLKNNKIIIFGGGTGEPQFSTDTAASIRAKEINADAILVAKNNTDGIYDSDPNINTEAIFYNEISYKQIIEKDLKVIDHSALKLLYDSKIDLIIFNMNDNNFIKKIYNKENRYTKVFNEKK